MDKKMIIVSIASWRFVVPGFRTQTFRQRSLPLECIKLKPNGGDIFALQLRGHIAFANTYWNFMLDKFGMSAVD